MVKAEWGIDYDWRNDKCFDRPMHKKCDAPIIFNNGKYICIGCGKRAKVSKKMKLWIEDCTGEKTEVEECMMCHQKTLTIHYHKNPNTLDWETGYGECSNCGMKFMV